MKDKLVEQKHGVSTTYVGVGAYHDTPAVYKYLKTRSKFVRELTAYQRLSTCAFVPKLLSFNESERCLIIQYVGTSLDIKYRPPDRKIFKHRIQEMHTTLIKEYGVHHNDIRWKNVVESDNGKLYLIDFERWTSVEHGSIERDPEKILDRWQSG
jgi:RIO-like serine/threonine protein kinase